MVVDNLALKNKERKAYIVRENLIGFLPNGGRHYLFTVILSGGEAEVGLACGLGRATALTSHRDVIHYRVAAALLRSSTEVRGGTSLKWGVTRK